MQAKRNYGVESQSSDKSEFIHDLWNDRVSSPHIEL
jgi:hypothetical protein